jgi:hypothetical protein
MARIYNTEQNNPQTLVVRQLLRNTEEEDSPQFEVSPTNYPSPDSSANLLINESLAMSESESLTPSVPPQSQLTESLKGASQVPLPINSESLQSSHSSFEEFRPPIDPRLMPQYLEIVSRPGPKSLKRKRLAELVNNSQEVPTRNIPPAESNENLHQANILRMIHERTKLKKPRNNTSSASSSLASNSSYRAPTSQPIPAMTQSSQDENLRLSPRSIQLTQQSPSVEPIVQNRRRRLPSSSLSSNEERDQDDRFGGPRGAITGGFHQPSPDRSPPLPAAVQRVSPPLPPTVRRRVNDGNAHSNRGAPRRVVAPSLITPATGLTGRNPRATNAKMITGG